MKWVIFLVVVYGNTPPDDAVSQRATRYLPGVYETMEECKVASGTVYRKLKGAYQSAGLDDVYVDVMCTTPEDRQKIANMFNIPSPINGE